MPKNRQYWEALIVETTKKKAALKQKSLSSGVHRYPLPPRKYIMKRPHSSRASRELDLWVHNAKGWKAARAWWRRDYHRWVCQETRRRQVLHQITQADVRIAYFKERIEALCNRTAWDRVRQGNL